MKTVLYFAVLQTAPVLEISGGISKREISAGVLDYALTRQWNLRTIETLPSARDLHEMLDFWSPDGCIVMCSRGEPLFPVAELERFPLVFIDRENRRRRFDGPYVKCDNAAVAQIAARELLSNDSKSHVFVRSEKPLTWCQEREAEFARILRLNGKHLDSVAPNGLNDAVHIKQIAETLKRLPRPIGVFAANDVVANKTLAACQRLGLSVPDDVSVLGVDNDTDICEYAQPTLSSIGIDFRQAGLRAAEALDARMSGDRKAPTTITYPPTQLIRRESTRRLKKTDDKVNEALEIIRKDVSAPVTAAKIAAIFPCSRRMAEIRFHAATGRSILEEIQATRLAKAEELLAKGNLQIATVANLCGYRSTAAFSKFFRQQTGMSPSSDRRGCGRKSECSRFHPDEGQP